MQSQIDPELPEETSGPNVGKILISRLRTALGIARVESTTHGTAIEGLQDVISVFEAQIAQKLDSAAATAFATSAQGVKADNAILYDAATGKGKLPDGSLITLGGAVTPTVLSVGNGNVTFGA